MKSVEFDVTSDGKYMPIVIDTNAPGVDEILKSREAQSYVKLLHKAGSKLSDMIERETAHG